MKSGVRVVLLALIWGLWLGNVQAQTQSGAYARGGAGLEWTRSSRFTDRSCDSSQPPALFGCVLGSDGAVLSAQGDFGRIGVIDAGLGYRLNSQWRIEGLINYREGLDFRGRANFLDVSGIQPVDARGNALSAFAMAYYDFPVIADRVQPFVGAGAGITRNRIGGIRYRFPDLGSQAATITSGGRNTDFAYSLSAGLAMPINNDFLVDLAYRYTDLGRIRTGSGTSAIIRSGGSTLLDIAGTQARLKSHGVSVTLRYGF